MNAEAKTRIDYLRLCWDLYEAEFAHRGPMTLLLFGSTARGEPRVTSDVDLLFVGPRDVIKANHGSIRRFCSTLSDRYKLDDWWLDPVFKNYIRYTAFLESLLAYRRGARYSGVCGWADMKILVPGPLDDTLNNFQRETLTQFYGHSMALEPKHPRYPAVKRAHERFQQRAAIVIQETQNENS